MWAVDKYWSVQWPIVAAALVIAVFVFGGGLPPMLGAAGFAVLAGASLLAMWTTRLRPDLTTSAQTIPDEIEHSVLHSVIEALPDPVVAVDRGSIVVAFNGKAREIAPTLRQGEPVWLALRMPALIEAVRRAMSTGGTQMAELLERIPVERWYELHVIPVGLGIHPRHSSGLLLLSFHDLTPYRRVERMRVDFVANASHELRTPLASLSGFIDTLLGPAKDDPAARERFLSIMQAQASRMARLIDDLLSLSRIELAEHIAPDALVDLSSVTSHVVDLMQALARERGVDLTIVAPAEPAIVRGDRDELIRVFENLVENALKYGASGKRVEIRFETVPGPEPNCGEAKVSVRDYGPGITAEHLPRLTERFYRVDVGQSRSEGGTGLGLALVKHILNRHRGRLNIASRPGEGSIFTVVLPLASHPKPAAS